jgi:hypothetical protein
LTQRDAETKLIDRKQKTNWMHVTIYKNLGGGWK